MFGKNLNLISRLTYNWPVKLLSVGLACILWIYVNSTQEKERFLSVELAVMNIPVGYIVSSEVPDTVQLVIRGREAKLALVSEKDVTAFVDLEQSTRLNTRRIVKINRSHIPQGVSIKEVNPRFVDIQVEKTMKKMVKVVPVVMEDLPNGYNLEDVLAEPDSVEIEGPSSLIESVDSVYTEEIDVSGMTETTVLEVDLERGDEKVQLSGQKQVKIRVLVKEEYAVRRYDEIRIRTVNVRKGLVASLEADRVSVLLKMPRRMIPEFRTSEIYVYVDCADIEEEGEYRLPGFLRADVEEASLISTIRIDPRSIKVRVEKEPPPSEPPEGAEPRKQGELFEREGPGSV